ncbi:MAG: hypothetical protein BGO94_13995 [Micrococcales bacterium 72-143]|nr:MAG: hypothetical protein BGO94_13995 [Micrococcales bacterium 72-143]
MTVADDDGFIGMPPGIFDSGTFKLPPKPERPRVEREEIVFVPTAPGMPLPVPEPTSSEPEPEPQTDAPPSTAGTAVGEPVHVAEPASYETQRAIPDPADSPYAAPVVPEPAPVTAETPVVASPPPAPASPRWTLVLADGGEAVVGRALLVGRNPAPFDAWPGAELLPVDDPTHSVSKTHAAFEVDDSGLWVHDLGSTNGVWVVHGDDVTEAAPGRRVAVPTGSFVELGDYVLTVREG